MIQTTRPEVLLLNDVDRDPDGEPEGFLQESFRACPGAGASRSSTPCPRRAVEHRHRLGARPDIDGEVGGPDDAYGFGSFEGQYGLAVLSRHPIVTDEVRTFQHFLWADMPGAALPATPEPADWSGAEELEDMRLSSKRHRDVLVEIDGAIVHLLAGHPTAPTFDGEEDASVCATTTRSG